MPKSDSLPTWRLRRFFISSVEDAVLERSAALESLCYGIGFGRLGRSPLFYGFTYICYVLVVVLPLDAELRLVRTWTGTSLGEVP